MRPRVYLAGPIGGLSYEEATTWRNQAKQALADVGIAGYSPMRAKDFLESMAAMPSRPNVYNHPLATSKGIMARDHNDAVRADAILVNFLGAEQVSLGTAMELAWAFEHHIPVVVVSEPDNINVHHPMASEAINYLVPTLSEALDIIKTICLPDYNGGEA